MIKIAITGGIGTGKSSLCQWFANWNLPVISADKEAHKALQKDSSVYPALLRLFHKNPDDDLNPEEIAKEIFSKPDLKKQFESIVHPYIFESILREEKKIKNHSHIFYEIPLLFETNSLHYFNWIILVICSEALQKERIITKMRLSEAEAQMRIDAGDPHQTKIERSDIIIENNGSPADLEQKAKGVLKKLSLRAESCLKK